MQCSQKGHENYLVEFVCLNESCQLSSYCCQQCRQLHANHQEDCLQHDLIQDYIFDKYLSGFLKTVEQYQKSILELILRVKNNVVSPSQYFGQNDQQAIVTHLKQMVNVIEQMGNLSKEANQIKENEFKAINQILNENQNKIQELNNTINSLKQNIIPLQNQQIKIKQMQLETTLDQYNIMQKELEKNNQIFTDQDFPTNANSIGFDCNELAWARASEFCQGTMKFFCDENGPNVFGENGQVKQNDIIQGTIGNDRLFGIVYLLANHCPKLLEQNFITKQVNQNCIYAVKLYHQDKEKIIVVDDYLPYNWDYLLHIKLLGKDYSIWIGILEKAIAKIFGSYHQFGHLTDIDLIQTLINVPYVRLITQDDQFLENIQKELAQNCFLFVGPSTGIQNNQGLDPMNFYQIIGLKEFYHPDLKEIKLLELKCPWGGRLWKGDWSYKSPLLTPELKKLMNYDKEDNGVFYMDQFSFMQHFLFVQSFKLNANKISSTLVSCRKKHAVYCKIRVDEPSSYFIQLKRVQERDVHVVHKVVVISCDDDYKFDTCYMQDHLDTQVNVNLRKGTYILYIKVLWDHQDTEDLQLKISGSFIVEIAEIQKIPNLLRIVFDKVAKIRCQQKQVASQSQILFNKLELDGWVLYIIENPFENLILLRIQCKLENAKLSKPHNLDNFKQQLPPKSYFTILIKKYYKSVIQINPEIIK